MSPVPSPVHTPRRPAWECLCCDQTWPCAPAKADLLQEYTGVPSNLAIYMGAQMVDALSDMTSHRERPPADLYERFLGWVASQAR